MSKKMKKQNKVKLFQPPVNGPKVLLFDIETAPIIAHVWSIWNTDVGLNQIQMDWHCLSWSAKWLGDSPNKVMYMDQRNAPKVEDDSDLLKEIWKLLDQADIVIGQNGKNFDHKKLNARFIINGFQPPSTYKIIDTKIIASQHFGFTSNRLEYLTDKLNVQYKKSKHKKFPGHELWTECLKGNVEAWNDMEHYNKLDVLALEELYNKLAPWAGGINFNIYNNDCEEGHVCKCGSKEFSKNGFYYTATGKYQKHKCKKCGAETRDRENLLTKEQRAALHVSTPRT